MKTFSIQANMNNQHQQQIVEHVLLHLLNKLQNRQEHRSTENFSIVPYINKWVHMVHNRHRF